MSLMIIQPVHLPNFVPEWTPTISYDTCGTCDKISGTKHFDPCDYRDGHLNDWVMFDIPSNNKP